MSVGIAGSTTGLSDRVDFSQVVKVYGKPEDGREARYSPGEVTEIKTTPIIGNPDTVAQIFKDMSEAGMDGMAVGLVNFINDLPLIGNEVLPRMAWLGIRGSNMEKAYA